MAAPADCAHLQVNESLNAAAPLSTRAVSDSYIPTSRPEK